MSIRLNVTKPARIAACSLFGLLAISVATTPAMSHHNSFHADGGTTQSTTTPPPPPPTGTNPSPNGLQGWQ